MEWQEHGRAALPGLEVKAADELGDEATRLGDGRSCLAMRQLKAEHHGYSAGPPRSLWPRISTTITTPSTTTAGTVRRMPPQPADERN
ncbi:hypothetical protein Scani_79450 [Streptomyces caniferus]|uniref:Uncharacterized protein n=1 Tax=Streptomyces caniferus TaxID=285557 RepID=A0A640SKA0_9ACTN|nr:hypothetical protein [Streptomyces caniferus]GFE11677.1 hypothetical protein Scani_79450 [Streptomyces caniferus]